MLVRLLVVEAVQKDLGLTADQMEKFKDSVKISQERSREFFAKRSEHLVMGVSVQMSEEQSREFLEELKKFQRQQKELRAQLVWMLTPGQSERLKQIRLQQSIAFALAKPELIKALDISEEQLAKICPINNHLIERQLAESHVLVGLDPKERHKKLFELTKKYDEAQAEANKLALEILAPEQRAKLDELVGKEIEVTWDYEALIPDDGMF
jgi:hypothetical protein